MYYNVISIKYNGIQCIFTMLYQLNKMYYNVIKCNTMQCNTILRFKKKEMRISYDCTFGYTYTYLITYKILALFDLHLSSIIGHE